MKEILQTCSVCRFWEMNLPAPPITGWPFQDWGVCTLFSDDASLDQSRPVIVNPPEALASACPFAGAEGASFDTAATFGCVQWERKL